MWRSFFCAIGLSSLILGGEFLLIDHATLKLPNDQAAQPASLLGDVQQAMQTKDFVPPDWAPWSLLSFGAVVVLYATGVARE